MWEFLNLVFQFLILFYFLGLNAVYLFLNVVSLINIQGYMQRRDLDDLPTSYLGLEPPLSLIAPAYNEAATIVTSVRSLLQLNYAEFEIIVVNDGSKDNTLQVLIDAFNLVPFPEAYRVRIETQPVKAIYVSEDLPNLRVIDKANGGKADALNVGINAARYPLFCAVDADSILQRESLERVVQPFLEDPTTVASGGTVRVANGCRVEQGFMVEPGLPKNPLALLQVAEYLRAFLFGRLGWSPLNAMLIISGAFGVFKKDIVMELGGYHVGTLGEDMELVVRLHRNLRLAGKPYRIVFVADPICWTEVPEDLATLKAQRVRWQRGLGESLFRNRRLLFNRRGGLVGWLAFPFALFFEWFGPIIEIGGYLYMVMAFLLGMVSLTTIGTFFVLSIGLGILLSSTALLLEELSFHIYRRRRDLFWLLGAVIIENFGYRQLISFWRALGLMQALLGQKGAWGKMKRSASWTGPEPSKTPAKR